MSNITRLYEAVRAKVPACAYVRVPHWNLRSTWEAVLQEGEMTPLQRDAVAEVFDHFTVDARELDREQRDGFAAQLGHGDVGAAGMRNKLGVSGIDDVTPTLRQRMVDLERRVLTLELRFSAKALDEADAAHAKTEEANPGVR
jgi:hypothetical protein